MKAMAAMDRVREEEVEGVRNDLGRALLSYRTDLRLETEKRKLAELFVSVIPIDVSSKYLSCFEYT